MHRPFFFLLLPLTFGCASTPATPRAAAPVQAAPAEKKGLLSLPEILQRMEASPVKYELGEKDSPPDGWADTLWPQRIPPLPYARVVREGGSATLAPPHETPESERLLAEAEPHFKDNRFDEAAKFYARATDACPTCANAWIFRGDAALFAARPEEALGYYRKAAELNPDDYRGHFFMGHALSRLGRRAEAREAFASALVLNPRLPTLRTLLKKYPGFGLVITPDVVVPRGMAERTETGVAARYDGHYGTAWLAFAACKAMWLGEPSHRKEMTGSDSDTQFTSTEELECLSAALTGYEVAKEQKDADTDTTIPDKGLERLERIVEAGMVDMLVLFELASRVHPQATLTMSEDARQRLRAYILEFVLLERG
ncbi:tetratricopeptide repeat protein [Corallococcus exiguus]|uniref:Tetratricopeptide repeat protein n=1 Tax=Corallococcus exiguus TaxID=83462 RepID=A0A7X4YH87_9BACT|nr:tetratricopeptide repeat protein [Corallococcus exiguus]NBC44322.1 tetratricopeptide repeat protein [Corallococcus exiguus]TNV66776.1 tetratricopeptide repeat protein [Corallococcus exiguus]